MERRGNSYSNCQHLFQHSSNGNEKYNDNEKKRTCLRKTARESTVSNLESGQMRNVVANANRTRPNGDQKNTTMKTTATNINETASVNHDNLCKKSSPTTIARVQQQSIFTTPAEPPPTCRMLKGTCEVKYQQFIVDHTFMHACAHVLHSH